MEHTLLSIAIPFDPAKAAAAAAYLDTLGNPATKNVAEALDAAAFVHFMSINAIPGDAKKGEQARLVIEASVDGVARPAMERLAAVLGPQLSGVFAAAGISPGSKPLADFLRGYRVKVGQGWFQTPGLDFDGSPGMSVVRIRRESVLARTVAQMLDKKPPFPTARQALEFVRSSLWNDEAMKWAFVPEPTPMLEGKPERWKRMPMVVWSAITNLLWPFLLLPLLVFFVAWCFLTIGTSGWIAVGVVLLEMLVLRLGYVALRTKEERDISEDVPPSPELVREMMKREARAAQGLLAAVSIRKPGFLRWVTLRVGLWFASLTYWLSRPGFLTKIGVIHFARWILLPGTNKLVFFSNYDGAWESYLEDFIERGYRGVTSIWSNTVGFPKTAQLLGDGDRAGARDGDRLRRWTRRQMFPAQFWYTAYPHLTLTRVRINAAIRQGLATASTETQAADWLACFGSAPRTPETLEVPEIPTLVFGGLGKLRLGISLFVRLGDDRAQAKAWLKKIEPAVTFGHNPKPGHADGKHAALTLGLTQSGLAKLGVSPEDLKTFPVAFQDGNAAEWRARALGDVGNNAPEFWQWGSEAKPVDAVLLVYSDDDGRLGDLVEAHKRDATAHGHDIFYSIAFKPLPDKEPQKEPFGFADGMGQPIIRGTQRAVSREKHHQAVAPGEFVLGYPDNLGYIPSTPTVSANADPANILPSPMRPTGQRPNFAAPLADGRRDLGANGTYLVVRQLEQDVEGFNGFLANAAAKLAGDPRLPSDDPGRVQKWLAAKMVGRWQEGSSLVRYPDAPGFRKDDTPIRDNDFLPGAEDPSGLRCPLGAHIRRANPRESFDPGSTEQLAISNRHRIFRVGRVYEPQQELKKPGLVFMCLNTDFERQFEFVQQTWLMAPSFHGLEGEVDPVLNNDPDANNRPAANVFTIPTPRGPICVKGLKDFVTVRGGGYFFMPGRRALHYLAQ